MSMVTSETQSQDHLRPTAATAQPLPLTQRQDQPCSITMNAAQLTPQVEFQHLHPITMTPTQSDQLRSTITDIAQLLPQTQLQYLHLFITQGHAPHLMYKRVLLGSLHQP